MTQTSVSTLHLQTPLTFFCAMCVPSVVQKGTTKLLKLQRNLTEFQMPDESAIYGLPGLYMSPNEFTSEVISEVQSCGLSPLPDS